jgi:hypothetical protein
VGGFNLSLVMRQLLGKGMPRGWQRFSADAWLAFLLFCCSGSRFWLIERATRRISTGPGKGNFMMTALTPDNSAANADQTQIASQKYGVACQGFGR